MGLARESAGNGPRCRPAERPAVKVPAVATSPSGPRVGISQDVTKALNPKRSPISSQGPPGQRHSKGAAGCRRPRVARESATAIRPAGRPAAPMVATSGIRQSPRHQRTIGNKARNPLGFVGVEFHAADPQQDQHQTVAAAVPTSRYESLSPELMLPLQLSLGLLDCLIDLSLRPTWFCPHWKVVFTITVSCETPCDGWALRLILPFVVQITQYPLQSLVLFPALRAN